MSQAYHVISRSVRRGTVQGNLVFYCLLDLAPPVNLANDDVTHDSIYVNNAETVITEAIDANKNLTLTAYQVCSCTSETISISATNCCGREGRRSPITMVTFNQESRFLPERTCEAIATTTQSTSPPTPGDSPKNNCKALSVTYFC